MSDKTETTALALLGTSDGIELLTEKFNAMLDIGKMLVNSGLVPYGVKTPEAAVAIVLAGRELGMGVMASLRSFHVVEGKPVMEASAQLARALTAGVVAEWKKSDEKEAILKLSRAGISYESRWTFAMAERAGLTKETRNGKVSNWIKSPEAMLRARAVTAGIRAFCPDVLGGGALYSADELERDDTTHEEPRKEEPRKPYSTQPSVDAAFEPVKTPEDLLAEHGVTVPMFDAWRESQKKGGWATLDDGQKTLIANRLAQPGDKDVVRKSFDAFVKAYQEFSENEDARDTSQDTVALPPEPPKPKEGHDPSFTEKARKAFMAGLSGLTPPLKYDDLARFTEATGRGRPSSWDEKRRVEVFLHLRDGGGNAEVQEWLAGNPKEGK